LRPAPGAKAAELARLGKDDAEQLDDWFNAAAACEALQRLGDALALYERILQHPRVKRDPALTLDASLRYGELTKAGGRADLALTHFEAAEPLARAMNRSDRMRRSSSGSPRCTSSLDTTRRRFDTGLRPPRSSKLEGNRMARRACSGSSPTPT
jgi:tetratricopeptide (TPR) repeat protein